MPTAEELASYKQDFYTQQELLLKAECVLNATSQNGSAQNTANMVADSFKQGKVANGQERQNTWCEVLQDELSKNPVDIKLTSDIAYFISNDSNIGKEGLATAIGKDQEAIDNIIASGMKKQMSEMESTLKAGIPLTTAQEMVLDNVGRKFRTVMSEHRTGPKGDTAFKASREGNRHKDEPLKKIQSFKKGLSEIYPGSENYPPPKLTPNLVANAHKAHAQELAIMKEGVEKEQHAARNNPSSLKKVTAKGQKVIAKKTVDVKSCKQEIQKQNYKDLLVQQKHAFENKKEPLSTPGDRSKWKKEFKVVSAQVKAAKQQMKKEFGVSKHELYEMRKEHGKPLGVMERIGAYFAKKSHERSQKKSGPGKFSKMVNAMRKAFKRQAPKAKSAARGAGQGKGKGQAAGRG